MAEQRGVTEGQLSDWARYADVGIATPRTVRALIAEVRAGRTREAELLAETAVSPSGGAGTPTEPVSGGTGQHGGHWCDVADNAAAQLATAEDQLARYKAATVEAHQIMGAAIVRGGYRPGEEQRVADILSLPVED